MSSIHFFVILTLVVTATGSVQTPWQVDVNGWKWDDLPDGDCKTDLQDYKNAIVNLDTSDNLWALQMLDSSAKVPNGILALNTIYIGMFEECLAVRHPTNRFQGKHCMLSVDLTPSSSNKLVKEKPAFLKISNKTDPQNRLFTGSALALKYGVCIPSTCSASDLKKLIGNMTRITSSDANCWTDEKTPLSDLAIIFISFSAFLAALTVASTCYHYVFIYQKRKPNRLLCAFSIYLNLPKLIEIRSNDEDNMGCLHGIRTLSMMWVMLCHSATTILSPTAINPGEIKKLMFDKEHIIISNGFFSVNSFFFLSGLLVAVVFFRNISRNGTYDAPLSYIHRWLRLTPPLAMVVFATASLLGDMGYGPLWHDLISAQVEGCTTDWWSILLYVQNYVNAESQCVGQSWYLSADMQMFWIAPFLLYPIYLWPTYGMIFLGLVTIASTLWTFAFAYTNNYSVNLLLLLGTDQYKYDYVTIWARITPYLVGIVCGVGICAIKARKIPIRISTPLVLLGWCFSTALCLAVLYTANVFYVNEEITSLESAFYISFSRLGWGLGLTWIVFACIHGYGGLINTFLSMGIWQPLGKLSYAVFLIHKTVLTYKSAILQTNTHITNINLVYEFLATLVISYLISLVLYLTVEAPFVIMDQELLKSVRIYQYPKPKKDVSQSKKKNLEENVTSMSLEKLS